MVPGPHEKGETAEGTLTSRLRDRRDFAAADGRQLLQLRLVDVFADKSDGSVGEEEVAPTDVFTAKVAGRADPTIQAVVAVVVIGRALIAIDALGDGILVDPFDCRAKNAGGAWQGRTEDVGDVLRVEVGRNPALCRNAARRRRRAADASADRPATAPGPFANRHRITGTIRHVA